MSAKKLSIGEKKFINAYNGNVKETAESLKLSYGYCRKLMTQDYILDAISKREEKLTEKSPAIATRRERQEFWSQVMRGEITTQVLVKSKDGEPPWLEEIEPAMRDRLKAAELLGKSNADFTENVNVNDRRGVKQEITDNMPQREATNNYITLLKEANAGNA